MIFSIFRLFCTRFSNIFQTKPEKLKFQLCAAGSQCDQNYIQRAHFFAYLSCFKHINWLHCDTSLRKQDYVSLLCVSYERLDISPGRQDITRYVRTSGLTWRHVISLNCWLPWKPQQYCENLIIHTSSRENTNCFSNYTSCCMRHFFYIRLTLTAELMLDE